MLRLVDGDLGQRRVERVRRRRRCGESGASRTKETRDREWAEQLPWKLFRRYKWADGKPVPAEGKAEGIYKLDGDSLTLCWRTTEGKELRGDKVAQELKVRPSLFQSDLYYHQFLFVLERVKPEK